MNANLIFVLRSHRYLERESLFRIQYFETGFFIFET